MARFSRAFIRLAGTVVDRRTELRLEVNEERSGSDTRLLRVEAFLGELCSLYADSRMLVRVAVFSAAGDSPEERGAVRGRRGGSGLESVDQRRIQGNIQLASFGGGHRFLGCGEQVLSVSIGRCVPPRVEAQPVNLFDSLLNLVGPAAARGEISP